ncbi:MAG: radical SAM protein [Candidatus Electrothrix communis]|nr:radical SAM protein [Desulfobulbus sp. US4]WLE95668.1 MAG: radical SAM protein [Candidatus Electrothrix communis]
MYKDRILRRVRERRLLHSVSLELTFQCNLHCYYCYNDRLKTGNMLSLDQYRVLLRDLAEMQTLFLMLTGGEPMLHPDFFEIGKLAQDLGFVVRVRTNGHILNRDNCTRLREEVAPYMIEVSLHGATADVHDRQTRVPGSFDRLLKNLSTAMDVGLRCSVVTTPTAWNEHQIEEMLALCDALGLPLRFQGPVGPRDNGDTEPLALQPAQATWDLISALQKQRRHDAMPSPAQDQAADLFSEEQPEERAMCGVGVSGVDIDPFGNVQACMHLQEPAGNLHRQSIKDIWNHSPLFQQARQRAVSAAKQFTDTSPRQFGAPLYCIAVEENIIKGCGAHCGKR